MNTKYSGSFSLGATEEGSLTAGGWTADGQVVYDIADDGIGRVTWNLTGSPSIS